MGYREMLKDLREKNMQIKNLEKEAVEMSKSIFSEFCREIFENFESLQSFSWNQYTPYFNDGESCIFSANTDYIKVNGEYIYDCEWFLEEYVTGFSSSTKEKTVVANPSYDRNLSDAAMRIQDLLGGLPDSFYEEEFGDHTEITVSREGIEVEDYQHE